MNALARFVWPTAALLALAAMGAHAGGPLSICDDAGRTPVAYSPATVNLNYDMGNLGSRTKAQADTIVTNAVALWTNVGTATVVIGRGADLPVDVDATNYLTFYSNTSLIVDGLNPVIYDTDGSIIDTLLGAGAKSSVLGFAGSGYYLAPTCKFVEGYAVINGFLGISDTTMSVVIAHEMGHLIGMDHTQLDNTQGLATSNYPLMYPIAYRSSVTLHEDDVAAVSALYPDTTLNSVYGQISGAFVLADGVTPVLGANLWATETTTGKVYSIVSDYRMQGTGYFRLLLPAGTYNLRAEAIYSGFNGGSSVGPYSEVYPGRPAPPPPALPDYSFLPPLYSGSTPMATVTLGGGTPTAFPINPGCSATLTFRIDGTGTVGGNCVTATVPGAPTIGTATAGNAQATVTFTPPASNGGSAITGYTVTSNPGSIVGTGTASPITVTGLVNGTAYTFTVTATNAIGTGPASAASNSVTPASGIPVLPPRFVGVFRGGFWFFDNNGNNTWDGTPTDQFLAFGLATDMPVVGDWNGDGRKKIGIYRDGFWVLDYNGNGVWDGTPTDRVLAFGLPGDIPVVGDWNGNGFSKIGVFRNGFFFLDYNGNGVWEGSTDRFYAFGLAGDLPVAGDWNGDGRSKIGVYRNGFWFLDYNGNGVWNGSVTDQYFTFGTTGDRALAGRGW